MLKISIYGPLGATCNTVLLAWLPCWCRPGPELPEQEGPGSSKTHAHADAHTPTLHECHGERKRGHLSALDEVSCDPLGKGVRLNKQMVQGLCSGSGFKFSFQSAGMPLTSHPHGAAVPCTTALLTRAPPAGPTGGHGPRSARPRSEVRGPRAEGPIGDIR